MHHSIFYILFIGSIVACNHSPKVSDPMNYPDPERYENQHRWQQDVGTPESESYEVINGDTINQIDQFGLLQGEWERLHPDGSFKCRGKYKDGYKTGYWERKYPNGNWRYQVNMEDGYQHGYCKHYYPNGNLKIEGNYEEGLKEGIIKTYYNSGVLQSEESFVEGFLMGQSKYFDEDGIIGRKGNFVNDQRDGEWIFYSDSVTISATVFYKLGEAIQTK